MHWWLLKPPTSLFHDDPLLMAFDALPGNKLLNQYLRLTAKWMSLQQHYLSKTGARCLKLDLRRRFHCAP
jgi:hypothetical protein